MAKSNTQKKYAKQRRPAVPPEISAATDYIKQWTTRELGKLQTDKSATVCVPITNGYKIGLYHLHVYANKTCDVKDHNREFVHRFENKVSAILYTIYTIKRQYWTADDLLMWDTQVNKNYTDMLSLQNTIEKARQRKDYVTVDTRLCRLEMAETQLNHAREQISKIHKTAKYYKIWE